MLKKSIIFIGLLCIVFAFAAITFSKQGNHTGEQKMLDVDIQFINSYGKTITNENGVYYYYYDWLIGVEDKVYPSKYWGEYPLYFFGLETGVLVKVTNLGPKQKAKVRIVTESYVLRTDGSNGASMMEPKSLEVEVLKGETKTINASFTSQYTPDAESGLDRFIVKVLHINEGGGPGNSEPGLIMSKEGVYCPPEYVPGK